MDTEFPASAEPLETSLLSSGISAEIQHNARPGDRVTRGKTLIRLDCRDTRLRYDLTIQELRQAEVKLKFSERQLARIVKLAKTNIASEELKDTRETELQQARIGVDARRVTGRSRASGVQM